MQYASRSLLGCILGKDVARFFEGIQANASFKAPRKEEGQFIQQVFQIIGRNTLVVYKIRRKSQNSFISRNFCEENFDQCFS